MIFLFYYLQQKTEIILWEESEANNTWTHEKWKSNCFDTWGIKKDARSEQNVRRGTRERTAQEYGKGKGSGGKRYYTSNFLLFLSVNVVSKYLENILDIKKSKCF